MKNLSKQNFKLMNIFKYKQTEEEQSLVSLVKAFLSREDLLIEIDPSNNDFFLISGEDEILLSTSYIRVLTKNSVLKTTVTMTISSIVKRLAVDKTIYFRDIRRKKFEEREESIIKSLIKC